MLRTGLAANILMAPQKKVDVRVMRTAIQCLAAIAGGTLAGAASLGLLGFFGLRVLGLCRSGDTGCGIAAWFLVAEMSGVGALLGLTVGTCCAAEIVETRRSARRRVRALSVARRSLCGVASIAALGWLVRSVSQGTSFGSIVADLAVGAALLSCGFFALRIRIDRAEV